MSVQVRMSCRRLPRNKLDRLRRAGSDWFGGQYRKRQDLRGDQIGQAAVVVVMILTILVLRTMRREAVLKCKLLIECFSRRKMIRG